MPIPVALCGKNPIMASHFTEVMGLEYYGRAANLTTNIHSSLITNLVSHVFHHPSAVSSELPGLLRGDAVKPSSDLGTNASADKTIAPKAVIVGAGFSRSELDQMLKLEGAGSIPWLYPSALKMAQTGASTLFGGDFMSSIVNRAKSTMREHGLVEGKEESVKPGVWDF